MHNKNRIEQPIANENKNVIVIDSWPKVVHYLGAVALEVPGALVRIFDDIETFMSQGR